MRELKTGAKSLTRREGWIAALVALLLGVALVGRAVWDGSLIYYATDAATVQAPWSATAQARNPELSDQAVAFYPHYVRVSERLRTGEWPLWNPDLYVGVPLAANPQWGAYDPQVLVLAALESIGGRTLFDRGFAWLAVLRIAAATLGAYLLARRLRVGYLGAWIAGLGFGLSGSLVLWLGFSLAHVTPLLPWVLIGLEGLRARRCARAFIGTSSALALAVYGGHPESSFFVGLAAGLWALSSLERDRRAGLLGLLALAVGVMLAAPVLLPFVEYLENSGALIAHELAQGTPALPDLVSLGALLLFAWGVWTLRARELSSTWTSIALGVAGSALIYVLQRRGLILDFSPAGSGFIERGGAWLAPPVFALALAAVFHGLPKVRCGSRMLGIGLAALLLAMGTPGVLGLWQHLPLAGLAAPARAACVSALFLPLIAGAAIEVVGKRACQAAFLTMLFVIFSGATSRQHEPLAPALAQLDASDEVVVYQQLPPEQVGSEPAALRGELRGGLPLDGLYLTFERLDERGVVDPDSLHAVAGTLGPPDREGTRSFDFGELELARLEPGHWRLRLDFMRAGESFAARYAALVHAPRPSGCSRFWLILSLASAVWLYGSERDRDPALWVMTAAGNSVMVGLTLIAGLWFARGWNPSVPRAEHFSLSDTEAFLREHHMGQRLVAEAGILPGDTALLAGLTTIDGYDAMDVASFDGYRAFALKPGSNPLLDWNARGMDLRSPAFRLLGVRVMLSQGAVAPPGWRLIAGPDHQQHQTEVFIFEAEQPLPRAFCIPQLVTREAALSDLESFDPERTVFLEDSFTVELAKPFKSAEVRELFRAPERLAYAVSLDGEAIFLSTEQHFPGWRVSVDGQPRALLRANSIFRAVHLGAGEHVVVFEYTPASRQRGAWIALLGLVLVVLVSVSLMVTGRQGMSE